MSSQKQAGADLQREQRILDRWSEWVQRELPQRRSAADRAYKKALQTGDEASWQHAEIMERSYAQLADMIDHQDPYFARIRGRMRDVDGEPFSVDLRVHRYHRSETFPDADGHEMLDISHLAPLADLVRNPLQQELILTLNDREFLQMRGSNPHIRVIDCVVEDVELKGGQVVRVAPRYGAIFEDRVRRRLSQSAMPALDVLADVLDREQNAIVGDRSPHLSLLILDGPAGTGKTVVAAHRIAVAMPPDSPGWYLTPTPTLRDYVRPVLPRLGLERGRAQAWSIADLAAIMWPDFPWDNNLAGMVKDTTWTARAWQDAFATADNDGAAWLTTYRQAAKQLGHEVGVRLGLTDVAPLLWMGALFKRPRPQPEPRWIIIDEAQAIPLLVYRALAKWLSPHISWVIAGDLMQQDDEHDWNGWEPIQHALGLKSSQVASLWLAKSYRVPPKIHAAAERIRRSIQPGALKSESVPWHPHVGEITVRRFQSQSELAYGVGQTVSEERQRGRTAIALLVPNLSDLPAWEAHLRYWAMDYQLLRDNTPYRGGLVLTTLDFVRGLEFDVVFILEVTAQAYPRTPAGARTLYTSLTRSRRAAHLVALNTPEEPASPWLDVVTG